MNIFRSIAEHRHVRRITQHRHVQKVKTISQHHYVWLAARLVLGGLFLLTSIPKIADINGFIELIKGYGLLPDGLAALSGTVLPWVELFLGCSLILGVFVRFSQVIVIPMSASFAFGGIWAMTHSSGIICGCFGSLIQISHPVSLGIDAVMFVSSIIMVTQEEKDFLMLGLVLDRINPDLRAKRRLAFNAILVGSVLLAMAIIAVLIFALK